MFEGWSSNLKPQASSLKPQACNLEIGQVNLGLPVRLEQDSIDNVDVDRSSRRSSHGFQHRGQAQVAAPTKNAIRCA